MAQAFSDLELEAYLDEALPAADMAAIEEALRGDPSLAQQLSMINGRRDAGVHTLGEIWRRHHVSCPSRDQLGSFLLDALPPEAADYIRFHIERVGCRFCGANLDDLRRLQEETAETVVVRRSKYFQSSAGYLHRRPGDDDA